MSFSVIQHYNSVKALKKPQTEKNIDWQRLYEQGKIAN